MIRYWQHKDLGGRCPQCPRKGEAFPLDPANTRRVWQGEGYAPLPDGERSWAGASGQGVKGSIFRENHPENLHPAPLALSKYVRPRMGESDSLDALKSPSFYAGAFLIQVINQLTCLCYYLLVYSFVLFRLHVFGLRLLRWETCRILEGCG